MATIETNDEALVSNGNYDESSDGSYSSSCSASESCSTTPDHSPHSSPETTVVDKPFHYHHHSHKRHHGNHSKAKYKLISDGEIQVCKLNHRRTILSKIMNSKYLRRWEPHHLVLGEVELQSSTVCDCLPKIGVGNSFVCFSLQPVGFMETALPYSSIEDINIISRWDAGHKFCIRLTIPEGSLLLQVCESAVYIIEIFHMLFYC